MSEDDEIITVAMLAQLHGPLRRFLWSRGLALVPIPATEPGFFAVVATPGPGPSRLVRDPTSPLPEWKPVGEQAPRVLAALDRAQAKCRDTAADLITTAGRRLTEGASPSDVFGETALAITEYMGREALDQANPGAGVGAVIALAAYLTLQHAQPPTSE